MNQIVLCFSLKETGSMFESGEGRMRYFKLIHHREYAPVFARWPIPYEITQLIVNHIDAKSEYDHQWFMGPYWIRTLSNIDEVI